MEELKEKLLDVSDPLSVNYGKHMTKDEVHSMTANPTANLKIKEYLTVKGAQVLSETLGGEFISARGSIKVWEEIFKTEFFSFNHIRAENDVHEVLR
jgi:subtilase family serine protease